MNVPYIILEYYRAHDTTLFLVVIGVLMFSWIYDNILSPVGNWISDAGNWLYDNVTPVRWLTDTVSNVFDTIDHSIDTISKPFDSPGGIGDFLTGGAYTQNETNRQIASENLAYQREANEQNIAFQREENEITRQREDTAVQRAAADMQAAGLSQSLAAGHPASSAVLAAPHVQPLHNDYKMEKLNHLAGVLSIAKVFQELKTSDALANKYTAEAQGQNLSNGVFAEGFANDQAVKMAQADASIALADYNSSLASLNQIKGKTYGDYLLSELDNLRTNTKLTNEEISYKVAQKEHLGKEDQKIIYDILESEARLFNYEHDLAFAKKNGLPVGTVPNGLLGGAWTSGRSIGTNVRSWLRKQFGLGTADLKLPDNISFGGGRAW